MLRNHIKNHEQLEGISWIIDLQQCSAGKACDFVAIRAIGGWGWGLCIVWVQVDGKSNTDDPRWCRWWQLVMVCRETKQSFEL